MFNKSETTTLKNTTILYVEDEEDIQRTTAEILGKFVKKIILAKDGIEGLELFKSNSETIDIIISDVNMPKMDGLEMSKAIKEINHNIPIIITSAYSDTDYLLKSIDIGIDKYVLKPIDIEQLVQKMIYSLHYFQLKDLYTDSLTGLKNRNHLIKHFKDDDEHISMACINIDRLSMINDLYGFEIGDKVIVELTNKIIKTFEDESENSIYSLDSDKFIVAYKGHDTDKFQQIVADLQEEIQSTSFIIDGCEIYLTLSVGIANNDFGTGLKLFNNTMRAIQVSIENQKSITTYSEKIDLGQSYQNNIKWIKEITNFKKDKHFNIYLQPTFHNGSSDIKYYKVLFRHIDEDGTVTEAGSFLDIIKKAKLFLNVIKVVLEETINILRLNEDIKLAMIISFDDISDSDTYAYIIENIKNNSDISKRLIMVISESEEITDYQVVNNFIKDAKEYGIAVGLDNFGSKYSNFNLLTKLDNISYLKIDKSIIEEIEHDEAKRLLIDIIVAYCEEEHIETIAGFIENENLYRIIRMTGVDLIQGYYMGMPQSAKELGFNS
jgi:diguanylate cyclase (GGDEF)-like protein